MIGIYRITSPSGKVYIGQSVTTDQRVYQYRYADKHSSRKHLGPKLFNSIQKHGWNQHKFEIIEECSVGKLNERETYWKQYYLKLVNGDWKQVLFCDLFDNGGGPRSEETKRKISKSNMGKLVSIETRLKKQITMLGRTFSDETKNKMSMSHKGKPKSKEHIKNMMKNRANVIEGIKLANSKPVDQYDLQGTFIKSYNSISEAKKVIKGDINSCCKGKQKTAGGFVWKFKIK